MFVSGNFQLVSTTSSNRDIQSRIGQIGSLIANEGASMRFACPDGKTITSSPIVGVRVNGCGRSVNVQTKSGTEYRFVVA